MTLEHQSTAEDRAALEGVVDRECGIQPIQFVQVTHLASFGAEYALEGEAIVVHFFLPPGCKDQHYWQETFPILLDKLAQEYFRAKFPQLKAAFTAEMNSWWLRAENYPFATDAYVVRFLEKLDQATGLKHEPPHTS